MVSEIAALRQHTDRVEDVGNSIGLLGWDMEVNMPEGGAAARGRQIATLARIAHDMATSDEMGRLIEAAEGAVDGADYASDDASLVRIARYNFDNETKIPGEHVARFAELTSVGTHTWAQARAKNDFAAFAPTLEEIVAMVIKSTEYLGYEDHPYDALINQYERGMTTQEVARIFNAHKPALVDLVRRVGEVESRVSSEPVHRSFPIDRQREFGRWIIQQIGFDFHRGRTDESVHPFCSNFSRNDVRLTTRFEENFLNPALFGVIHESGHGMYEQGSRQDIDGTPLAGGTSLGVHESQSRLWENIVGRSRGFWEWAYPKLQSTFPETLNDVSVGDFYKAINTVERQFIRVEADEATYNLHIMVRFDLECDMVAGKVKVADLPREWNDRFEAMLGIRPPTDTLGVLQDIHWSSGLIGYFPTYALGNLLSVQYYTAALKAHPSIPAEIEQGKFDTLLNWLKTNIYQHGKKFTSAELTRQITGGEIDPAPYVQYLETKYSDIYAL